MEEILAFIVIVVVIVIFYNKSKSSSSEDTTTLSAPESTGTVTEDNPEIDNAPSEAVANEEPIVEETLSEKPSVQSSDEPATEPSNDKVENVAGVTKRIAEGLHASGITTVEQLQALSEEELLAIKGIGKVSAAKIIAALK